MKALSKISDIISEVSKIAASILIGALTIVLVIQVILRIFFSSGLAWSVEFSTFAIIWAVMLIANVLIKNNEMISVDFFDHLMSEKFKRIRNIIYQVVFIFLLVIMTIFGWHQAVNSIDRYTSTMGISWFYPYLSIPVGSALMLYQYIYNIFFNIVRIKKGGE